MKEIKGCGMRSSVGFLSRRKITGQPLMKEEFQRRRLAGCNSLYKKDMLGHFGCVNAIEFSNSGGEWLVSGGDDRRVLLWHMEKALHSCSKPLKLKGEHLSNIFCLAFDSTNRHVFSGGNDEQVILHDVERGETVNVFLHDDAVYGLSVSPVNDNVFASSSDDGRVLIWDTREPPHGEPFCLANYPSAFHSVMFNPAEPRLLATANSKEGVGLWDIRKPRSSLLRYGGSLSLQSAMSVRFNSTGTQLLALRRRLPPVLYELHSRLPSFQFDNQGYFNSCTMKSCCFAGDRDQYILSGSDDFNLYMWRIPKDPDAGGPGRVVNGAFMILKGHRSIVNQVRFNPHTYMICSSGVEKVIKVWSPYQQPESVGDLEGRVEDKSRSLYTHEEYISLVLNSGSGLSHDYVSQSIQEDPRMMAFFDSLVRREIEGWSSDSDSDLSEGAILQLHARGRRPLRSGRDGGNITAPTGTSPASGQQSDDSSSIVGPHGSEGEYREELEGESWRSGIGHQSMRLMDLVNDSSDSSGFWPDPMPRPRSPSPRNISSLSSHSSSPIGSSSSNTSSSTSSSETEEEERRRARTRQRNATRRRRMRIPCHKADRSESAQTLYSGVDSCSYPKISLEDSSSSSSLVEAQDSVKIVPQATSSADRDRPHIESRNPYNLSPIPSPDRLGGEVRAIMVTQERESEASPPFSHDENFDKRELRSGKADEVGMITVVSETAKEGQDVDLAQNHTVQSLDSAWGSPRQLEPGINGQKCHDVHDRDLDQNSGSSTSKESDGKLDMQLFNSKTREEKYQGSAVLDTSKGLRLKQTRVQLEGVDSDGSPPEKLFKT
ncbi:DDB1- and CUL4-associated factor 5 isoform X2 [Brienomyrus brachyistius]|uniref:DDB1- and CUL4-associated factor 5 isoform X2 n=1 Tax=Brienomyrus brachyistius TaxID=42636 RepID=UPI0020B32EEC|nr:DDB1- and CUL4-associated factor 5 isoform X2 [Brienomyrus brachyistius]